jgi:hypothetical protein
MAETTTPKHNVRMSVARCATYIKHDFENREVKLKEDLIKNPNLYADLTPRRSRKKDQDTKETTKKEPTKDDESKKIDKEYRVGATAPAAMAFVLDKVFSQLIEHSASRTCITRDAKGEEKQKKNRSSIRMAHMHDNIENSIVTTLPLFQTCEVWNTPEPEPEKPEPQDKKAKKPKKAKTPAENPAPQPVAVQQQVEPKEKVLPTFVKYIYDIAKSFVIEENGSVTIDHTKSKKAAAEDDEEEETEEEEDVVEVVEGEDKKKAPKIKHPCISKQTKVSLHNLCDQIIKKIDDVIEVLIRAQKVKTINASHVLTAVEILLINSGQREEALIIRTDLTEFIQFVEEETEKKAKIAAAAKAKRDAEATVQQVNGATAPEVKNPVPTPTKPAANGKAPVKQQVNKAAEINKNKNKNKK